MKSNVVFLNNAIENLKQCIDRGHDFELVDSWETMGTVRMIQHLGWTCKRCGYLKDTIATEEQEQTLIKYKTLSP